MPVTQEDVAWCYRSILRREAKSEAVLQRLTTTDDFRELVIKFINSVEFRQKSKTAILVPPDRPAMQVELDASPAELNRLRDRVREAWTHMGATRPHHSVLSRDDYLPKNINQKAIESFMASGNREALIIKSILERHNFELAHSKTCVEYGCGLGRVTIPIANMFTKIDAYDISPTHLTFHFFSLLLFFSSTISTFIRSPAHCQNARSPSSHARAMRCAARGCGWLRASHLLRCAPWLGRCQVGTGKQARQSNRKA